MKSPTQILGDLFSLAILLNTKVVLHSNSVIDPGLKDIRVNIFRFKVAIFIPPELSSVKLRWH